MSRLIHRSKPSEPTNFCEKSRELVPAVLLFEFCVFLGFGRHSFASTAQSARGSWLQMAAEGYESGYESGMNRGYESGDRFFSTGKTKSTPGAQRQLVFHCDSGPGQTAVSTASDRLQEASSKFQAQQRHPPPQRPAKSQRLTSSCTPPPQPQHHGCYRQL